MDVYQNLKEKGIELPQAATPLGLYAPVRQAGNLLFVSGQGPNVNGKAVLTGKVGAELSLEEGQYAASVCAKNILAALEAYTGDLNKIAGCIKIFGLVASAAGFNAQPAVINACSQMMIDAFGEAGRHARSAVGTNELPGDIPVEIEAIFELK